MKTELIEPFYEELRVLMFKYKIKVISGIMIDYNNAPDVLAATFDSDRMEWMKDKTLQIVGLFKDDYDIEKIMSGSIKGT